MTCSPLALCSVDGVGVTTGWLWWWCVYRAPLSSSRFASTLVVADHDDGALAPSTLGVITAAKAVGGPVTVLVAGPDTAGKCGSVWWWLWEWMCVYVYVCVCRLWRKQSCVNTQT